MQPLLGLDSELECIKSLKGELIKEQNGKETHKNNFKYRDVAFASVSQDP